MPIPVIEAQEKARACCGNPKMLITYLWFITLVFGFMYAVAAIVAAVNNNGSGEADSKSLGFVGVWAMLLIVSLSVGGTMVMRKYQTPLAVGFFIGVVIMMSLQMFSLAVLFAGAAYLARVEAEKGESTSIHSNEAASVFSFFMFILYVVFSAVLVKHRNVIIKEGLNLDPTNVAAGNLSAEKTAANSAANTTGASSPKVIRTDLEVGKPLAAPVSV